MFSFNLGIDDVSVTVDTVNIIWNEYIQCFLLISVLMTFLVTVNTVNTVGEALYE